MRRAPVNPRQLLTGLGLAVGLAGLFLQFYLSMQAYLANGRDVLSSLGAFFTYFTILTNIALVLVYLSELLQTARLEFFRRPLLRGTIAVSIALVSLYVFFVLRFLYTLTGLFQLADTLLHYVAPMLYLLWWLIAQPHGQLRWRNIPLMLLPPLVYFVLVMARGAVVGEYPYPFMNAAELGYGGVLVGALWMAGALAILAALLVALDHALTRNWNLVHD
jgi:hypothetical protein